MQSQLGMDLAADSLSTWRTANKASGLNDLSRADGMPMRMRTIEGIAPFCRRCRPIECVSCGAV